MLRAANKAALLLWLLFVTNLSYGASLFTKSSDASEFRDEAIDQYSGKDKLSSHPDLRMPEKSETTQFTGTRVLRHRARHHTNRYASNEQQNGSRDLSSVSSKEGSRKYRSKGSSRKYSSKGGSKKYSRSFLDPDIEPKPFINCIPLPPSNLPPSRSGSSKGVRSKGHRRKSRKYMMKYSMMSYNSRRNLKHSRSGTGSGKGSNSRSRRGMGRGMGMGMGMGMGRKKLPYCPLPTIEPTFFPTVTPIPTFTPLPTITPFPSFTPFPTIESTDETPAPTPAPTVSSQPSTRPSASNGPTMSAQPTSSPTAFTNGPTTRTISGRLAYAFFATTTIREPTTEEINGLVEQTEIFYSELMMTEYPGRFESLSLTNIAVTYDPTASLPVILDFDVPVVFKTNSAATPSETEVFNVAEQANYQNYITDNVWASEPVGTSLFFDTQRVVFNTRGGTVM